MTYYDEYVAAFGPPEDLRGLETGNEAREVNPDLANWVERYKGALTVPAYCVRCGVGEAVHDKEHWGEASQHVFVANDPPPPASPVKEPLLASDASRAAMERHRLHQAPLHEVIADAIWAAERRGVEATLKALGAEHVHPGDTVVVDSQSWYAYGLLATIEKNLGRGA